MLRLIFIIFSSFILASNSLPKRPVIIHSQKLIVDRVMDVATYEWAVRIEFNDYTIFTDKLIVNTYRSNYRPMLYSIEFPIKTRIVKNDNSEVIIVPSAFYSANDTTIRSKGDIYIEKDNQLYQTQDFEIFLGVAKTVTPMGY